MIVFFETTDFAVSDISAFEVTRDKMTGDSGVRPYHALAFRTFGDAVFTAGERSVHVGGGDVVFVPAFCPYHIVAGAEHLFVIHFYTERPIADTIQTFSPQAAQVYRQWFEQLVTVFSGKEVGYEYECKSIVYNILANIEREFDRHQAIAGQQKIRAAMRYIHQHFTERTLSVHTLAKQCFMSDTYFRKLFMQVCGCSPLTYINERRASYATELLKTKYYTVAEVSDMCGFSTPYYFSSFMKKKTGRCPVDWMKE